MDIETNAMNLPAHSFCADVNAMLELLSQETLWRDIRLDKLMNNRFLVPKWHDSYVPKCDLHRGTLKFVTSSVIAKEALNHY